MSAELSASVSVLTDLLLLRDNQDTCYHLFESDEIAIATNCICTDDSLMLYVFLHLMLFICARVLHRFNLWRVYYVQLLLFLVSCFMLFFLFLLCVPCAVFILGIYRGNISPSPKVLYSPSKKVSKFCKTISLRLLVTGL